MSCRHDHGPWCHGPYRYPPGYYADEYDAPPEYYYPPPRSRRRAVDADQLAEYLERLESEIARVRRDLDELRGSGRTGG